MRAFRRHLVACTVIWALGQLAWLSAFVPRDCCAAHGAHAVARGHEACQRAVAAAHAGDGGAHNAGAVAHGGHHHAPEQQAHGDYAQDAGHAEAHTHGAPSPHRPCVMRGMCDGPLSALASLISNQGVPQRTAPIDPDLQVISSSPRIVERAIRIAVTPDTPPPRV